MLFSRFFCFEQPVEQSALQINLFLKGEDLLILIGICPDWDEACVGS